MRELLDTGAIYRHEHIGGKPPEIFLNPSDLKLRKCMSDYELTRVFLEYQ